MTLKHLIFSRLVDCDYRSITDFDGRRFYIRFKNEDFENETISRNAFPKKIISGMCGVPYRELLEQATIEMSRLEQVKKIKKNQSIDCLEKRLVFA